MTTTHSPYERVNPFLLPEMLHLLYPLLSTEDILKAILICKYWNSFFIPRIWHTLCVGAGHQGSGHFHKLDQMDNLEHHIQFVRSLEIAMKGSSTVRRVKSSEDEKAEERLKAILVQCRELTRLKTDSVFEELFEVLANNRGTIVSFKLRSAPDLQYMPRLWHILGDDTDSHCMRNLSHLALTRVHLPGDGGDPVLHLAFVKLCRRLETLECYNCPMKDWAAPVSPIHNEDDPQQMPWALKRVRLMKVLDMMSVNTFFLKRCTSLEELFWSSCLHQDLDEDFLQFLAQSRLEFLSVDGLKLPDEFLTRLIEHLPPTIAKLRLNTQSQIVNMGPRFVAAAAAITSPSLSIISIIPSVSKLTSAPTQQLLSSCANIVRFDDSLSVDAVDLSTAPWVMSRLVALNLTIKDVASLRTVPSTHPGSGSSQSGGFDRMIYEQLSRLVSLEELVLTEITEETSWISFSLSHGMGVLAALAHLRRLDISGLQGLRMGATEGQWICGHWPALEYLVVRPGKESLSHLRMMSCLRKNHPELKFNKWTL